MRLTLALALLAGPAWALDFFVSPEGNDNFIGTEDRPLATLAVARDRVRASGRVGKEPVHVWLEDGVYRLEETWIFRPDDGGEPGFPVSFQARHPGQAVITGEKLATLLALEGSRETPVAWLRFSGLVFRRNDPAAADVPRPLPRTGRPFRRTGAVMLSGTEDCVLEACTFERLAGHGLVIAGHARRVLGRSLLLREVDGTGIAFLGFPAAVRPSIAEGAAPDLTPGPAAASHPTECVIEDTLLIGNASPAHPDAAILLSASTGITLRHLTIRAEHGDGIHWNDGSWGGHLVEGCDVATSGLGRAALRAHGQDRFWSPERSSVERAVAAAPALPTLDAERPTEIRTSRWRADSAPDLVFEQGATNYRVHHNLFLHGGVQLGEGYARRLENNVFAQGGLRLASGYARNRDRFTRNLLDASHQAVDMPAGWGEGFDANLFRSPEQLRASQGPGREPRSLAGPAGFLDPARGDYRIGADSPARQLGFGNFPMDEFGVRPDNLRRLAPSPRIDAPSPAR